MRALAPIIDSEPRLLILGSMPSSSSLQQQQYYAHPQNAFWWLMQNLLLNDAEPDATRPKLDYPQRCSLVIEHKIAIWDVLAECDRPGSLDSNIVRSSEQTNDFESFFKCYRSVKLIAFNGGAAQTIFMRHCRSVLQTHPDLSCVKLPSTSPAHAALSKQDKLAQWRSALIDYL